MIKSMINSLRSTTRRVGEGPVATGNAASPEEDELRYARECLQSDPYLRYMPQLSPKHDLELVTEALAREYPEEFCWSTSYDLEFMAELMYRGFITMSNRLRNGHEVLLPKLHTIRCIVDFKDVPPVGKKIRKKSKKFSLSADTCIERVIRGIVAQHGENWFYPKLVKSFVEMNRRQKSEGAFFRGSVRLHSFELWDDATGELVAGEVGYTIGDKVYTSLSGYCTVNDSGNVQMALMFTYLRELGFELWDLGMCLAYKIEKYGGMGVPRLEFLRRLKELRDLPVTKTIELETPRSGKDFKFFGPPSGDDDETSKKENDDEEGGDMTKVD